MLKECPYHSLTSSINNLCVFKYRVFLTDALREMVKESINRNWVMLTMTLVKEVKRENFKLKMTLFILLRP
jgi:hypothetical protein